MTRYSKIDYTLKWNKLLLSSYLSVVYMFHTLTETGGPNSKWF